MTASADVTIRRILTLVEDHHGEAGAGDGAVLRKVAVTAIVRNPFAGRSVADLAPLVEASAGIAREIVARAVAAMGPHAVQSYGKGGVVGVAGEQEHAVALLTTVFGDAVRAGVGGGRAWISSVTKRGGPGVSIDVPLAHKDALYVRSHYDAVTVTLADAPLPDEIAVIAAFANRGRLNHRVGGLAAADVRGHDGLV